MTARIASAPVLASCAVFPAAQPDTDQTAIVRAVPAIAPAPTPAPAIAIGVGCRFGSPAAAIEALVRHALTRAPDAQSRAMFTIRDKANEAGLTEAAQRLGLDLVFLSREVLREQAPLVQTRSPASNARFGVPSVAEAAALAGAGPNPVLIVPRIARQGVTCAIAASRAAQP